MTGTVSSPIVRKYVPHLPSLLAVCDVNYGRLMRLLPDCDSEDLTYRFVVKGRLSHRITIIESSRYTSTIEICQQVVGAPAYMSPTMQVRLYHDAQMAEVIKFQRVTVLKASYRYPNMKMHQKNEKELVNRFLGEWLVFCSKHSDTLSSSEV